MELLITSCLKIYHVNEKYNNSGEFTVTGRVIINRPNWMEFNFGGSKKGINSDISRRYCTTQYKHS